MAAGSRDRGVPKPAVESAILGALLLCVVVSSVAGAEAVFFSTVAVAWLLLPAIVGIENTLDAGKVFTLVSLGVLVAVAVAHGGLGAQFP